MCRTLAISICRRLKYFDKSKIMTILAKSTGWKAKEPKSNQLCAPLNTEPATNKNKRTTHETTNKTMIEPLRRKNRQSTAEAANSKVVETNSQIICLTNKAFSSPKAFMVKTPKREIKNRAPKSSQSTEYPSLLNKFGIILYHCRIFCR